MATERVTRQLLQSASRQLDAFTAEGGKQEELIDAIAIYIGVHQNHLVKLRKSGPLKLTGSKLLGGAGFLQFFRVVSSDYSNPRFLYIQIYIYIWKTFVWFLSRCY